VVHLCGAPRVSTPTFVTTEPFAAGRQVTLGEDEAHHMRVRRLDIGTRVMLLDGQGVRGAGALVRLAKRNATIEVETVESEPAPRAVHLLLPIADKDRMLWLAEKAAELGATSWRPVQFRRSRSVAAKGEGTMFTQKVAARMVSALEQSGSAWMPALYPESPVDRAVAAAPEGVRVVLDGGGESLARLDALLRLSPEAADDDAAPASPVIIAVGPEGGIEEDEMQQFTEAGFARVSIGTTILRFETAAIAALGIVRSLVSSPIPTTERSA
jgi:16S rRNA (uracil1498-N3)-methyltransferase